MYSVLLYDKENRQKQSEESFKWGSYRQGLHDFQLVTKRDNPTMHEFSEASVGTSKGRGIIVRPPMDERRKVPFVPDGRYICFNYNSCFSVDRKLMLV